MPERFRHGLVLGKFYPLHAGHSHLIRTALSQCETVTVELLGASVESIPLEVRAQWLRDEHPTARVRSAIDDLEIDFHSEEVWNAHMRLIESLLDEPVDAVFTSDDYGHELASRLGATWVQVDPGRVVTPVSGTAVRADVAGSWHLLGPSVREWLTPRVVVLGAESTGSTTLAAALAEQLEVPWVAEYGRTYSEIRPGGLSAPWTSSEFLHITEHQIADEQRAARQTPRPLLICDTDVLATALWHERYIGVVDPELLRRAAAHPPLLYVLTGDEIPFVQDGMRDGEHIRSWMQQRFRDELGAQPVEWVEVRGTHEQRLEAAVQAIAQQLRTAFDFADPIMPTDRT